MTALAVVDWFALQGPIVWWASFVIGALVGGFLVGLAVEASAVLVGEQKLPAPALWVVRILAGILCGWLLALALSGRGFPGPGGLGGDATNPGGSGSPTTGSDTTAKKQETTGKGTEGKPRDKSPPTTPRKPGDILVIEVLPRDFTAELKPGNQERGYRVTSGTELPVLLDLAGIVDRIRKQTEPRIREAKVVLYQDSPAEDTPRTAALLDTLRNLPGPDGSPLKVGNEYEPRDAPR